MNDCLEFHPDASLFPLMQDTELERLKADIVRNGQISPIELWEGKVLDGRNRLRACRLAGIAPRLKTLEALPGGSIAYVLAANLNRRHLRPSQLAMVAARVRDYFDAEAQRRRQHRAGETSSALRGDARDQAGAVVGVSGRSVDAATQVMRNGVAELIQACDRGALTVSRAARLSRLAPDAQRAALQGGRAAIEGAIQCVELSARRSASQCLQRLIQSVLAVEDLLRSGSVTLDRLRAANEFSPERIERFAGHLSELSMRLNQLVAHTGQSSDHPEARMAARSARARSCSG